MYLLYILLQVCVFVDCCCALIERRDLVPGPVAATRIISALLSFAEICGRNKRYWRFSCDVAIFQNLKLPFLLTF